jgi:hypothetical protein
VAAAVLVVVGTMSVGAAQGVKQLDDVPDSHYNNEVERVSEKDDR